MLNEKQLKTVLALIVFGLAFAVYLATMAPTVSFWDCGELVGASNILGNPHPPGNPLFTTLARVFILVAPFKEAATRVNFISALTSALTVMMCFLFIVKLLAIVFQGKLSRFATYVSAAIGCALVTFSDTFWFSAVEAEVYGTSMLLVMCISWLSLDWYERRGTPKANRILLLITYLGFLGMGVHPFSFITIPAVGLFIIFSDENHRKNWLGFVLILGGFVLANVIAKGAHKDMVWAYGAVLVLGAIVYASVPDMKFDLPLAVTGLGLFSIVFDIGDFIFYAIATLVVAIVAKLIAKTPEAKSRWKLSMLLTLVALLGFSSYSYVPIRSSVNPNIDENEPRTWTTFKEYLERKQYGSESMLSRAFHRRGTLVHQLLVHPHMGYGGYMLSQYFPWKVGETRMDENEPVVRDIIKEHKFNTLWKNLGDKPGWQMFIFLLFQFPFLYGGYLVYKRNPHLGAYLLILYAATSYGLVFYMNFADGSQMEMRDYEYWKQQNFNAQARPENVHIEVRDRDYFFTPGFMYMGILFGVASAFLLNKLGQRSGGGGALPKGVGVALLALAVAVPAYSNYKEHNRHGDYIPWDYAYNLLMSCRPNSVLFTNGDNDTFPLWFIQEVEGVRKDVRVVNLSLVNTNWYVKQLKTHEPKLTVGFSDEEINTLEPQPWRFKQAVGFKVPNSNISVEIEPRGYLKVQDIMVLHIVQNNYPKHPIHFAVTVSDDNMMGLEKYLVMEGMVYTLVEERKNKEIDAAVTARMVDSVYRFRGLGDPKLFVDLNTEGLLTNYSATNFRLVMWAQERLTEIERQLEDLKKRPNPSDSVKVAIAAKEAEKNEKIAFAEKYLDLNARILPREWRNNYYGAQLYASVKDFDKAESFYRKGIKDAPNPRLFGANLAQLYIEQSKFAQAESLLNELKKTAPNDFELWYGLSDLYQKRGDLKKAYEVLSEWLKGNPSHQYASMVTQQLQFLESQIRNQSAPALPPGDSGKPSADAKGVPASGSTITAEAPSSKPAGKPAAGGIPGLGEPAKGKPAEAKGKEKDTALKGTPAPAGKS
jgi:tetratricopeptide (TPR) repeat protein